MVNDDKDQIRRQPGRPKAPLGSARANRVVTFVTDEELSRLHVMAKTKDCSMSAMVHRLITRNLLE